MVHALIRGADFQGKAGYRRSRFRKLQPQFFQQRRRIRAGALRRQAHDDLQTMVQVVQGQRRFVQFGQAGFAQGRSSADAMALVSFPSREADGVGSSGHSG